MKSLPATGTECRNSAAAAPTASTGTASERKSRGCSRIWRMTMSTRTALTTYMVAVFMPLASLVARWQGVGPRVGPWVDNHVNPRVDPVPLPGGRRFRGSHRGWVQAKPGQARFQPGHPHPQRPAVLPGRPVEQEPPRVDGAAADHQVVHPVIDVTELA